MMKKNFVVFILMFACAAVVVPADAQTLRISDNHRYIVRGDGTPFLYLGDTAWGLFSRLKRNEADYYLKDRAEKGFTVIQALVLGFGKNTYGDFSLEENNPEKPNEAHFKHVDYIVDMADELGLTIGMLPTWGFHWMGNHAIFTPDNAYSYGKFLGTMYRGKPIIWILGGDENVRNENERAIIEELARGLGDGDAGEHLITFHPRGTGLSSDYFHTAEWLDFNMYQSSQAANDHDNGLFAENDYKLNPPKPTMDGEPQYETIPISFYFEGFNHMVRFDDYDCCQAAYWSLLAGVCGHTYGNNSVFQFHSGKK